MRLRAVFVVATLVVGYCSAAVVAPAAAQALPSTTELLQRVAAAAGGRDVEKRITSRVSNGFVVTPAGRAPLTLYQKAPDRFMVVIDSPAGGLSRNAFDGQEAWSENRRGVEAKTGPETGFVRREQTIHREIRLAELFQSVAVERVTQIDGRMVIVSRAVAPDGLAERFFFDGSSYLLFRHEVEIIGTLLRSDFDDYRNVSGAAIAHRIRRSRPDFSWSTELVDVGQNVPIEDALFARPGIR